MIMKELPHIKEQKRPQRLPTDFARSSIREWNFMGADTETLDGACYMLSLEQSVKKDGMFHITPNVYYTDSFYEIIQAFLSNGRIYHGRSRGFAHPSYAFYNLAFDAQALLKHLPNYVVDKIYQSNSATIDITTGELVDIDDEEVDHTNTMSIFYLPKKCLRFEFHKDHLFHPPKKGKRTPKPINGGRIEMWDISQFYGGNLNSNAKRYLNNSKKAERCFDGSILDVRKLGKEVMVKVKHPQGILYKKVQYEEYYDEDIRYYCAMDTHLCGRLARKKLKEFVDADVSYRDPYSIAAIAQRDILNRGYREVIPMELDYRPYIKIANHSFKGGWFEAAEVGMIEDVMCFDLKSAYPANQWNIPAMTKWENVTYTTKSGEVKNRIKHGEVVKKSVLRGEFITGKGAEEFVDLCEPRIDLAPAFCKAYFTFPEGKWNPLCYVGGKPPLTSPTTFYGWITYDEYKEATKWNPTTAIVEEYLVWKDETEVSDYPFRPFIKHWFDVKESTDSNDPAYLVSKVLLNSIYGKTIQCVEGQTGSLWNPFYASMTTAYTRMELARFNRYNGKKAVMFATDGIIIRKDDFVAMPERMLDCPKNLGKWEKEAEDVDALVMMSGVYAIREREATGVKNGFAMIDGKLGIEETRYKKEKSKFRGTASYFLNGEVMGWFDFCERFGELDEKQMTITKPYSMGEARHNFDMMNIFEPRDIRLKACGDSSKRLYDPNNKPATFADLLTNSYELGVWESYAHVDRVINGLVNTDD